jgi:hypothetical protein
LKKVTDIRSCFNDGSIQGIFEAIEMVTGLKDKHINSFTTYGIISYMKVS